MARATLRNVGGVSILTGLLKTPVNRSSILIEPLVSIVVSSYNRPEMFRGALLSLLAQSYANLEIVIQDDSTNDDCGLVVSELADPRIRYTRNRPALGTARNLREGYRKCTGKYFCTLNDDDSYHPEYLRTMVTALEGNQNYSLAFCDHYIIDQLGTVDEQATDINSSRFGRDLLKEGSVPHPLVAGILSQSVPAMFAVFRRDALDLNDFPDEASSGYDYWLTYLALRGGRPIYYSPQRLTYYRVHEGSQTSTYTDPRDGLRSLKYSEYMHRRFLADAGLQSIHSELRLRLAKIYSLTGLNWLKIGNRPESFRQFLKSCQTRLTPKGIAGLLLCGLPNWMFLKIMSARQTS